MNWININVSVLDSEEFLGADPEERATWLCLLRYCVGQENSGRIEGARAWKDRKWQQVVRVTLKEINSECDLWRTDGEDLVVTFYPQESEDQVKQKRSAGRAGGKARTEAKAEAARKNGASRTQAGTEAEPKREPNEKKDKDKDKEREGNEKKESESASEPASENSINPNPDKSPSQHAEQAREIVEAYPRREKQSDALRHVLAHLRDGEDFEAMLAGTRACAAVIRTLPSGHMNRYVPAAETFFAKKRWQDDPETMRRQGNQQSGSGQMSDDELLRQLGGRAGDT